jgi:hypothetical protein
MLDQANILKYRLDTHTFCDEDHCCDIQNDWKVITFFVGVCLFLIKKKFQKILLFYLGK